MNILRKESLIPNVYSQNILKLLQFKTKIALVLLASLTKIVRRKSHKYSSDQDLKEIMFLCQEPPDSCKSMFRHHLQNHHPTFSSVLSDQSSRHTFISPQHLCSAQLPVCLSHHFSLHHASQSRSTRLCVHLVLSARDPPSPQSTG